MMFMRGQLGKPVPSPVGLGQVSEEFREAVKEEKRKIAYEVLDNGFLSCAEPAKLQQVLRLSGAGRNRPGISQVAEANSEAC